MLRRCVSSPSGLVPVLRSVRTPPPEICPVSSLPWVPATSMVPLPVRVMARPLATPFAVKRSVPPPKVSGAGRQPEPIVGIDRQRAGVDRGAAGIGIGAAQDDGAGAGLDDAVGAGDVPGLLRRARARAVQHRARRGDDGQRPDVVVRVVDGLRRRARCEAAQADRHQHRGDAAGTFAARGRDLRNRDPGAQRLIPDAAIRLVHALCCPSCGGRKRRGVRGKRTATSTKVRILHI